MAYGYIDKTDKAVFHVIEDRSEAIENSVHEIAVEYSGSHENGYPTDADGRQIVVYSETMTEKEGLEIPELVEKAIRHLK